MGETLFDHQEDGTGENIPLLPPFLNAFQIEEPRLDGEYGE